MRKHDACHRLSFPDYDGSCSRRNFVTAISRPHETPRCGWLVSGPLILTNFHGGLRMVAKEPTSWKPTSRNQQEDGQPWSFGEQQGHPIISWSLSHPAARSVATRKKTRLINGLRLQKHGPTRPVQQWCWKCLSIKSEKWNLIWLWHFRSAIGGGWGLPSFRNLFSLVCNRWRYICLLAGCQETATCCSPRAVLSKRWSVIVQLGPPHSQWMVVVETRLVLNTKPSRF